MQVAKDVVVSIEYTLTDPEGKVLDSSQGKEALPYLHGHGAIIPGLERALEGKNAGDKVMVTIQPADAYGNVDPSMVQKVPKSAFQGNAINVGMQFQAKHDKGVQVVTITAIQGDEVTIDGNHPLAGVTLNFDVTIKDVRKATAEELAHGHVHGPGGHHHH